MIAGGAVMSLRSALFGKAFQERPAVKAMAEEHKKNAGRQTFCEKGYPGARFAGAPWLRAPA